MRVLITGGAGFIGSHLTDAFLARGDEVAVVDDLSNGRASRLDFRAKLHKVSVTDRATLTDVVGDFKPALVCHLAAQIDVRKSVADPGLDAAVNVAGTINVLEATRAVGSRVLFASSGGALYGENAPIPSPERTEPLPESPYGTAKFCGEQYIGLYNRLHGTAHAVLRLANVYGPRQDPRGEAGVIALFCDSVLAGRMPVVFGDGSQTRDYVYVGDVVSAFLVAADSGLPGIWNIGTGTETSVLDLLSVIGDVAGSTVTPQFAPARAGEVQRSAVFAGQAARDLGWHPATGLREGIAAVYSWIKAEVPSPRPVPGEEILAPVLPFG